MFLSVGQIHEKVKDNDAYRIVVLGCDDRPHWIWADKTAYDSVDVGDKIYVECHIINTDLHILTIPEKK